MGSGRRPKTKGSNLNLWIIRDRPETVLTIVPYSHDEVRAYSFTRHATQEGHTCVRSLRRQREMG